MKTILIFISILSFISISFCLLDPNEPLPPIPESNITLYKVIIQGNETIRDVNLNLIIDVYNVI